MLSNDYVENINSSFFRSLENSPSKFSNSSESHLDLVSWRTRHFYLYINLFRLSLLTNPVGTECDTRIKRATHTRNRGYLFTAIIVGERYCEFIGIDPRNISNKGTHPEFTLLTSCDHFQIRNFDKGYRAIFEAGNSSTVLCHHSSRLRHLRHDASQARSNEHRRSQLATRCSLCVYRSV